MTSIRELTERALEVDETSIMERIQLVLTKRDMVDVKTLESKQAMMSEHGFSNPLFVSSHSGEGIESLQSVVLDTLFGPKRTLFIHHPQQNQMASEAILSRIFDAVYVHEHQRYKNGIEVRISASDETIAILFSNYGQRIELK